MTGDVCRRWYWKAAHLLPATVCDFHSSLPLSLQCLSKNINKTPWRECQQDASQRGATRGEAETGGGGLLYINPETCRKQLWVIYIPSHAKSSFHSILLQDWTFNRASRRADQGSLADPYRPLRRGRNSKLAVLLVTENPALMQRV